MKDRDDASRSETDSLAGTPFRAVGKLGEGAMGIVYEAEHRMLRTRLVVKVLRAEYAADPIMVDRLRIEAQAAAVLSDNPHVVHVSDLGQLPDGRPYLVMQKLEGRNLRDEIAARGPLPVAEAVDLARQILAGLGAAHAIGVVHRDIKPANLFLCAPTRHGGRVLKILDFGIAKVLESADPERAPKPLAKPTQEGTAIGSPRYLAPEQAFGRAVDRRSDIYAVGAVLYWLLTGRDPFSHHKGAFAVMRAHVLEAPAPPSSVAHQAIPAALDAAILKALAKTPADRFDTAEEFSTVLEGAIDGAPVPRRWPRTERIDTKQFREMVAQHLPPASGMCEVEPVRDSAETLPLAGSRAEPSALAGDAQRGPVADTVLTAPRVAWPPPPLELVGLPPVARARRPVRRRTRRAMLVSVVVLTAALLILLLMAHARAL